MTAATSTVERVTDCTTLGMPAPAVPGYLTTQSPGTGSSIVTQNFLCDDGRGYKCRSVSGDDSTWTDWVQKFDKANVPLASDSKTVFGANLIGDPDFYDVGAFASSNYWYVTSDVRLANSAEKVFANANKNALALLPTSGVNSQAQITIPMQGGVWYELLFNIALGNLFGTPSISWSASILFTLSSGFTNSDSFGSGTVSSFDGLVLFNGVVQAPSGAVSARITFTFVRTSGSPIAVFAQPEILQLVLDSGQLVSQLDMTVATTTLRMDLTGQICRKITAGSGSVISTFGSVPNLFRMLTFGPGITISSSANLKIPGTSSITTENGDTAIATSDNSGVWTIRTYSRASGKPLVSPTVADISDASANGRSLFSAADYTAMRGLLSVYSTTQTDTLLNAKAALAGATFTGPVVLAADPSTALSAATKQYVDNLAAGLDIKASARIASTANLGLSGLSAIDGVTPVAGDRILVKDQTTPAQNGIYVAAAGGWTRATDMDSWAEVPGANVWVEEGTANGDKAFVCTSNIGGTLGTTAITWTQFGGTGAFQAASNILSAFAGLSYSSGSQVPVFTGASTFTLLTVGSAAGNILDKAAGDSLYQAKWTSQTANQVFAAPNGSSGVPGFRLLVAADLPDLSAVYQPKDPTLTTMAALVPTTDQLIYFTGSDVAAVTAFTAIGRAVVGAANAAAARIAILTHYGILETETAQLLNAMASVPHRKLSFLYDDLIGSLKDAGVWTQLTGLYILATLDTNKAGLNLVNPTGSVLSMVNAPTFVANQGYAGNGTSSYIDTQILLASGSKYAQDSASLGVVGRNERVGSNTKREIGTLTGQSSYLDIKGAAGNFGARINDNTGETYTNTTSIGFFAAARTVAGTASLYATASGATVSPTKQDFAIASVAPNTATVTLLQSNGTNYSDSQLSAAFWGAGLTQTQMNALYTALKAFLSDSSIAAWV